MSITNVACCFEIQIGVKRAECALDTGGSLQRLAQAVLLRAVFDATRGREKERHEAECWLRSDDCYGFCILAEIDPVALLHWLNNGKPLKGRMSKYIKPRRKPHLIVISHG